MASSSQAGRAQSFQDFAQERQRFLQCIVTELSTRFGKTKYAQLAALLAHQSQTEQRRLQVEQQINALKTFESAAGELILLDQLREELLNSENYAIGPESRDAVLYQGMRLGGQGTWNWIEATRKHLSRLCIDDRVNGVAVIFNPRDILDGSLDVTPIYESIFVHRNATNITIDEMRSRNPIVYALSYRHMGKEVSLDLQTFQSTLRTVARRWEPLSFPAEVALWIDRCMEYVPGVPWVDIGLAPYAEYGIVAIFKNVLEEKSRVWLWLERQYVAVKTSTSVCDAYLYKESSGKGYFIINGNPGGVQGGPRDQFQVEDNNIVVVNNLGDTSVRMRTSWLYRIAWKFLKRVNGLVATYPEDIDMIERWFTNAVYKGCDIMRGVMQHIEMERSQEAAWNTMIEHNRPDKDELVDHGETSTGLGFQCWSGPGEFDSEFSDPGLSKYITAIQGCYRNEAGAFVKFSNQRGDFVLHFVKTDNKGFRGHAFTTQRLDDDFEKVIGDLMTMQNRQIPKIWLFLEKSWAPRHFRMTYVPDEVKQVLHKDVPTHMAYGEVEELQRERYLASGGTLKSERDRDLRVSAVWGRVASAEEIAWK